MTISSIECSDECRLPFNAEMEWISASSTASEVLNTREDSEFVYGTLMGNAHKSTSKQLPFLIS